MVAKTSAEAKSQTEDHAEAATKAEFKAMPETKFDYAADAKTSSGA